jgi:hypothetical protein
MPALSPLPYIINSSISTYIKCDYQGGTSLEERGRDFRSVFPNRGKSPEFLLGDGQEGSIYG